MAAVRDRENDTAGDMCGSCAASSQAGLTVCSRCGRNLVTGASAWKTDALNGAWHTVGSALDADIHMPSAAGKHVRIRRVDGRFLELEDLGRGVMVDGRRVERAKVPMGARIELAGELLPPELIPDDVLDESELPSAQHSVVIGRDAAHCQFAVDDQTVSSRHARLTASDEGWVLEDLGSRNGTSVAGQPIRRARIGWRQPFYVADTRLTALEVMKRKKAQPSNQTSGTAIVSVTDLPQMAITHHVEGVKKEMLVGRSPDADIVVDSPHVSLLHAKVERDGGMFVVTDLKSTNGTFVDGVRIKKPTRVAPGQVFHLGGHPFKLSVQGAAQKPDKAQFHGLRVDLHDACLVAGGRAVVDKITVSVAPGEMVAIMGPSGAGKTSLLTLLAGHATPSSGSMVYDGLDAHTHEALFRQAVALVPQEDVMHRALTPSEVLFFTGRLNFPDDTGSDEIRSRAARVLRRLDLEHTADSVVGDEVTRGLSGGERRRVNVAMELMQEPALLLLDEPTSGLDGRSALQLVKQCRGMANSGRTVMMTIHQPREEALELFDQVLLLTQRGKLAYFGPPAGMRRYFESHVTSREGGAANPADFALEALDPQDTTQRRPPRFWEEQFRQSTHFKEMVQRQQQRQSELTAPPAPTPRDAGAARQWATLAWRYAIVKWRDRSALGLQMLQAPLIAFITVLLFHKGRFIPIRGEDDVTPALFIAAASAVWLGTSNMAREVVGDKAIYVREARRMVRPGPYLASLVGVQLLLMLAQLPLLVGMSHLLVGFTAPFLLQCSVVMLCGTAAMLMGLLLSTLVKTQMAAVVVVPLVILPQILLSGQLAPVAGTQAAAVQRVVAAPMLLRWAYSAVLNVEYLERQGPAAETPWGLRGSKGTEWVLPRLGFEHDGLWLPLLMVTLLGVLSAALAWLTLLKRSKPASSAAAAQAPPQAPS